MMDNDVSNRLYREEAVDEKQVIRDSREYPRRAFVRPVVIVATAGVFLLGFLIWFYLSS